jgi:hypothetical protein
MLHKNLNCNENIRSSYKRRFVIFLAFPVRKWLFCVQKSEEATK